MVIVGIDPGTQTGIATWVTGERRFIQVTVTMAHRAHIDVLETRHALEGPQHLLVIFEDARQRKGGFGAMDRNQSRYGAGAREGVGAAKRDAAIWEEFLSDHQIPFIAQYPRNTKIDAERFRQLTGWDGRTNEHGRDAGMLVYGIDARRAAVLMGTATRGGGGN